MDFSKNVNAEKWFPFSSALFPLLFLLIFLFFKIQRRKLADKNLDHRIFEIDFYDLLFWKIDLVDLDLLILKSRNAATIIWKLDFKKLNLAGRMCVRPKWWIRKMGLWFLKIDGTEIMLPVFAGVFLSASFVGSFSRLFFRSLFFFGIFYFKNGEESWRRNA